MAEAVNYRDFNNAKQDPLTHPAGDRILILTDTDGDGRADSSKVLVQDNDLKAPEGLAGAAPGTRVVVSASPHLIRSNTDEDGDDVPDRREVFLTGFGGPESRPTACTRSWWGQTDGFYFAAGNAGPHVVTDKSGVGRCGVGHPRSTEAGRRSTRGGQPSRARERRREGVGRRADPALRAGRDEAHRDGPQLP